MRKKLAIVLIVLALLVVGGMAVWAATPLDEILSSPTPEPTTAPVTATAPVTVVTVSGLIDCAFTVTPSSAGWSLHYSFTTPGTVGTLIERPSDQILDKVTVTAAEFPVKRPPITLEANASRKFTISVSGPGSWQYSVRPPDGTTINETFNSPSAAGQANFMRNHCAG